MRVDQIYMKRVHSKLKATVEHMEKEFKEKLEQCKQEKEEISNKYELSYIFYIHYHSLFL